VGEKTLLLVTEDDLTPESWGIARSDLVGIVLVDATDTGTGLTLLPMDFKRMALQSTVMRLEAEFQCPVVIFQLGDVALTEKAHALLNEYRASSICVMSNPTGLLRSLIEPQLANLERGGVLLRRLRRPWDHAFWPHATHGFFKLKERIPSVLKLLSLSF
jgi:deoxyribodipyrimidine photo-lyase